MQLNVKVQIDSSDYIADTVIFITPPDGCRGWVLTTSIIQVWAQRVAVPTEIFYKFPRLFDTRFVMPPQIDQWCN